VKRWLFSSFLVSLLSLGLAGTQAFAAAVSWTAAEEGSFDDRQEPTLRPLQESRGVSRRKKPGRAVIPAHPVSLEASFPSDASHPGHFVSVEVLLPDKIPILRV
jgi:hypothetical protein